MCDFLTSLASLTFCFQLYTRGSTNSKENLKTNIVNKFFVSICTILEVELIIHCTCQGQSSKLDHIQMVKKHLRIVTEFKILKLMRIL